jgi:hypothetical protein
MFFPIGAIIGEVVFFDVHAKGDLLPSVENADNECGTENHFHMHDLL